MKGFSPSVVELMQVLCKSYWKPFSGMLRFGYLWAVSDPTKGLLANKRTVTAMWRQHFDLRVSEY